MSVSLRGMALKSTVTILGSVLFIGRAHRWVRAKPVLWIYSPSRGPSSTYTGAQSERPAAVHRNWSKRPTPERVHRHFPMASFKAELDIPPPCKAVATCRALAQSPLLAAAMPVRVALA